MSETSLHKEEKETLFLRGYLNPVFFCHFYLHEWFPGRMPWVHKALMAILTRKCDFLLEECDQYELGKIVRHFAYKEDATNEDEVAQPIFEVEYEDGKPARVNMALARFTEILMPRGFSKTTCTNAAVLYDILYQEAEFLVYVSEAQLHAQTQLANVRRELESNERIIAVFGSLKPEQRQNKKWSEDTLETATGIFAVARGRGGQIRGLNMNGKRPDRIIVDDVEDKESVNTPEQRKKSRVWAYGDLIPALPSPAKKEDASIVAVGTLLHNEALLMTWARDPEFNTIVFGALDNDGDPLWPENMDKARLARVKRSFANAGELSTFYMEYFNTTRNEETAKFKQSYFIYDKPTKPLHKAIAVDPAISDKPDADFCAFAVVGMEETGRIHVLDMYGDRGMSPRDQVDKYFELVVRWNPDRYGVEANAYQAALIHLLREEMFRKGRYFEIEPIKHSTRKIERVEGVLQPRMAAGYVIMSRRFPDLEQQLLDWPSSKLDFPDVLAMAITLLDPYAAQAADPELDLGEDEYEELDLEEYMIL